MAEDKKTGAKSVPLGGKEIARDDDASGLDAADQSKVAAENAEDATQSKRPRGSSLTATTISPNSLSYKIEFRQDLFRDDATYMRTRHNSLRCFPVCAPIHKTKSFCGYPVYCTVTIALSTSRKGALKLPEGRVFALAAEFRPLSKESTFKMNDALPMKLPPPTTEQELAEQDDETEAAMEETPSAAGSPPTKRAKEPNIFQGRLFKEDRSDASLTLSYIFMPPGKWYYDGKLKEGERHVFTCALAMNSRVVSMKDSVSFKVMRIAFTASKKEEEEEDAQQQTQRMPRVSGISVPFDAPALAANSSSSSGSVKSDELPLPPGVVKPLQSSFGSASSVTVQPEAAIGSAKETASGALPAFAPRTYRAEQQQQQARPRLDVAAQSVHRLEVAEGAMDPSNSPPWQSQMRTLYPPTSTAYAQYAVDLGQQQHFFSPPGFRSFAQPQQWPQSPAHWGNAPPGYAPGMPPITSTMPPLILGGHAQRGLLRSSSLPLLPLPPAMQQQQLAPPSFVSPQLSYSQVNELLRTRSTPILSAAAMMQPHQPHQPQQQTAPRVTSPLVWREASSLPTLDGLHQGSARRPPQQQPPRSRPNNES